MSERIFFEARCWQFRMKAHCYRSEHESAVEAAIRSVCRRIGRQRGYTVDWRAHARDRGADATGMLVERRQWPGGGHSVVADNVSIWVD